jgi:hypothetical protein
LTRWTSRYEAVHGKGDAQTHHGGSNIVADDDLRVGRRTARPRSGEIDGVVREASGTVQEMTQSWEVGGGGGWRRRGAVRQGWRDDDECECAIAMAKGMAEWVVAVEDKGARYRLIKKKSGGK